MDDSCGFAGRWSNFGGCVYNCDGFGFNQMQTSQADLAKVWVSYGAVAEGLLCARPAIVLACICLKRLWVYSDTRSATVLVNMV